jgi:cation diffusion facilitator CzcD-associated flavoprotein CzcO
LKVVIIGSGGAGLAALGGVWATTRYPSLTIHSKSFNYRFHDLHPVASRGPSATREEILAYFAEFARDKGIADKIAYHRRIDRIVYRSGRASDRCLFHAGHDAVAAELERRGRGN